VARRPGYQDTSTLREPYRIEGKKTMGLEIAEQLGWRLPGVIVYRRRGVGIIGIYKALRELLALGWVSATCRGWSRCRRPAAPPIVRAFQAGAAASEPWPDARTVAFGITVPNALAISSSSRRSTPPADSRGRDRRGACSPTSTRWPGWRQLHLPGRRRAQLADVLKTTVFVASAERSDLVRGLGCRQPASGKHERASPARRAVLGYPTAGRDRGRRRRTGESSRRRETGTRAG